MKDDTWEMSAETFPTESEGPLRGDACISGDGTVIALAKEDQDTGTTVQLVGVDVTTSGTPILPAASDYLLDTSLTGNDTLVSDVGQRRLAVSHDATLIATARGMARRIWLTQSTKGPGDVYTELTSHPVSYVSRPYGDFGAPGSQSPSIGIDEASGEPVVRIAMQSTCSYFLDNSNNDGTAPNPALPI